MQEESASQTELAEDYLLTSRISTPVEERKDINEVRRGHRNQCIYFSGIAWFDVCCYEGEGGGGPTAWIPCAI